MNKKSLVGFTILVVIILIILATVYGGTIFEQRENELNARIGVDKFEVCCNEPILFDGTQSEGDVVSWEWDFNDGQTSLEPKIEHSFPSSGYYKVSLTVKDKNGKTDISIQNITIKNNNFHDEKSGMNLNGIGRGWVSDALWFQVKDGITKPTIYANCSGSANLAEIRVDIRSESMLLYRESTYVMNGGFKINTVIDPSEIEEFGEFSIWLGCSRGVINEYLMEVAVHY